MKIKSPSTLLAPIPPPHVTLLTLFALLALAVPACSVLSYDSPTGEHFTRKSFGAKTSVTGLR